MIPGAYITEWSQQCPWISPAQVEQDLVLSRALVEIYSIPALRESLTFRGGTALHKLILQPAARYSEDLDFVQSREAPIGDTLDQLRECLEPWLGSPKTQIGQRGATQIFRFESETPPIIRLRLKIEINTREHFHLQPLETRSFEVKSRWFTGAADIPIYTISELLGTKLRALYQRRKGRDLFDLWLAGQAGVVVPEQIVAAFLHYMAAEDHTVSRANFLKNLEDKMQSKPFLSDTPPLLRPGINFDPQAASDFVSSNLVSLLP